MPFIGILIDLLVKLLPWIFSGSTQTKATNYAGLEDMDRAGVSGTKGLSASDLPALALFAVLALGLSGCAFGGAKETHTYHLVEPGAVVEVIDLKGKCLVRSPGTDDVGEYDPVGKVLLPKSVYRDLRAEWLKAHPPDPTSGK